MDTMTSRHPEQRAREYAEGVLEVNAVYERAQEQVEILSDRLDTIHQAAIKRREVDAQIIDLEMQITGDERAANPEMSQAAFDKHIKVVLRKNDDLAGLRRTRDIISSEYELAERDAELARLRVRMESARLEELGGLLHFYGSVKTAAALIGQQDKS